MDESTRLRLVEEKIGLLLKTFECPICLDLMKNPVSTKCDHKFCRHCIHQTIGHRSSVPCPICKVPFTKRSLSELKEWGGIVQTVGSLVEAFEADTGIPFTPPRGASIPLSQATMSTNVDLGNRRQDEPVSPSGDLFESLPESPLADEHPKKLDRKVRRRSVKRRNEADSDRNDRRMETDYSGNDRQTPQHNDEQGETSTESDGKRRRISPEGKSTISPDLDLRGGGGGDNLYNIVGSTGSPELQYAAGGKRRGRSQRFPGGCGDFVDVSETLGGVRQKHREETRNTNAVVKRTTGKSNVRMSAKRNTNVDYVEAGFCNEVELECGQGDSDQSKVERVTCTLVDSSEERVSSEQGQDSKKDFRKTRPKGRNVRVAASKNVDVEELGSRSSERFLGKHTVGDKDGPESIQTGKAFCLEQDVPGSNGRKTRSKSEVKRGPESGSSRSTAGNDRISNTDHPNAPVLVKKCVPDVEIEKSVDESKTRRTRSWGEVSRRNLPRPSCPSPDSLRSPDVFQGELLIKTYGPEKVSVKCSRLDDADPSSFRGKRLTRSRSATVGEVSQESMHLFTQSQEIEDKKHKKTKSKPRKPERNARKDEAECSTSKPSMVNDERKFKAVSKITRIHQMVETGIGYVSDFDLVNTSCNDVISKKALSRNVLEQTSTRHNEKVQIPGEISREDINPKVYVQKCEISSESNNKKRLQHRMLKTTTKENELKKDETYTAEVGVYTENRHGSRITRSNNGKSRETKKEKCKHHEDDRTNPSRHEMKTVHRKFGECAAATVHSESLDDIEMVPETDTCKRLENEIQISGDNLNGSFHAGEATDIIGKVKEDADESHTANKVRGVVVVIDECEGNELVSARNREQIMHLDDHGGHELVNAHNPEGVVYTEKHGCNKLLDARHPEEISQEEQCPEKVDRWLEVLPDSVSPLLSAEACNAKERLHEELIGVRMVDQASQECVVGSDGIQYQEQLAGVETQTRQNGRSSHTRSKDGRRSDRIAGQRSDGVAVRDVNDTNTSSDDVINIFGMESGKTAGIQTGQECSVHEMVDLTREDIEVTANALKPSVQATLDEEGDLNQGENVIPSSLVQASKKAFGKCDGNQTIALKNGVSTRDGTEPPAVKTMNGQDDANGQETHANAKVICKIFKSRDPNLIDSQQCDKPEKGRLPVAFIHSSPECRDPYAFKMSQRTPRKKGKKAGRDKKNKKQPLTMLNPTNQDNVMRQLENIDVNICSPDVRGRDCKPDMIAKDSRKSGDKTKLLAVELNPVNFQNEKEDGFQVPKSYVDENYPNKNQKIEVKKYGFRKGRNKTKLGVKPSQEVQKNDLEPIEISDETDVVDESVNSSQLFEDLESPRSVLSRKRRLKRKSTQSEAPSSVVDEYSPSLEDQKWSEHFREIEQEEFVFSQSDCDVQEADAAKEGTNMGKALQDEGGATDRQSSHVESGGSSVDVGAMDIQRAIDEVRNEREVPQRAKIYTDNGALSVQLIQRGSQIEVVGGGITQSQLFHTGDGVTAAVCGGITEAQLVHTGDTYAQAQLFQTTNTSTEVDADGYLATRETLDQLDAAQNVMGVSQTPLFQTRNTSSEVDGDGCSATRQGLNLQDGPQNALEVSPTPLFQTGNTSTEVDFHGYLAIRQGLNRRDRALNGTAVSQTPLFQTRNTCTEVDADGYLATRETPNQWDAAQNAMVISQVDLFESNSTSFPEYRVEAGRDQRGQFGDTRIPLTGGMSSAELPRTGSAVGKKGEQCTGSVEQNSKVEVKITQGGDHIRTGIAGECLKNGGEEKGQNRTLENSEGSAEVDSQVDIFQSNVETGGGNARKEGKARRNQKVKNGGEEKGQDRMGENVRGSAGVDSQVDIFQSNVETDGGNARKDGKAKSNREVKNGGEEKGQDPMGENVRGYAEVDSQVDIFQSNVETGGGNARKDGKARRNRKVKNGGAETQHSGRISMKSENVGKEGFVKQDVKKEWESLRSMKRELSRKKAKKLKMKHDQWNLEARRDDSDTDSLEIVEENVSYEEPNLEIQPEDLKKRLTQSQLDHGSVTSQHTGVTCIPESAYPSDRVTMVMETPFIAMGLKNAGFNSTGKSTKDLDKGKNSQRSAAQADGVDTQQATFVTKEVDVSEKCPGHLSDPRLTTQSSVSTAFNSNGKATEDRDEGKNCRRQMTQVEEIETQQAMFVTDEVQVCPGRSEVSNSYRAKRKKRDPAVKTQSSVNTVSGNSQKNVEELSPNSSLCGKSLKKLSESSQFYDETLKKPAESSSKKLPEKSPPCDKMSRKLQRKRLSDESSPVEIKSLKIESGDMKAGKGNERNSKRTKRITFSLDAERASGDSEACSREDSQRNSPEGSGPHLEELNETIVRAVKSAYCETEATVDDMDQGSSPSNKESRSPTSSKDGCQTRTGECKENKRLRPSDNGNIGMPKYDTEKNESKVVAALSRERFSDNRRSLTEESNSGTQESVSILQPIVCLEELTVGEKGPHVDIHPTPTRTQDSLSILQPVVYLENLDVDEKRPYFDVRPTPTGQEPRGERSSDCVTDSKNGNKGAADEIMQTPGIKSQNNGYEHRVRYASGIKSQNGGMSLHDETYSDLEEPSKVMTVEEDCMPDSDEDVKTMSEVSPVSESYHDDGERLASTEETSTSDEEDVLMYRTSDEFSQKSRKSTVSEDPDVIAESLEGDVVLTDENKNSGRRRSSRNKSAASRKGFSEVVCVESPGSACDSEKSGYTYRTGKHLKCMHRDTIHLKDGHLGNGKERCDEIAVKTCEKSTPQFRKNFLIESDGESNEVSDNGGVCVDELLDGEDVLSDDRDEEFEDGEQVEILSFNEPQLDCDNDNDRMSIIDETFVKENVEKSATIVDLTEDPTEHVSKGSDCVEMITVEQIQSVSKGMISSDMREESYVINDKTASKENSKTEDVAIIVASSISRHEDATSEDILLNDVDECRIVTDKTSSNERVTCDQPAVIETCYSSPSENPPSESVNINDKTASKENGKTQNVTVIETCSIENPPSESVNIRAEAADARDIITDIKPASNEHFKHVAAIEAYSSSQSRNPNPVHISEQREVSDNMDIINDKTESIDRVTKSKDIAVIDAYSSSQVEKAGSKSDISISTSTTPKSDSYFRSLRVREALLKESTISPSIGSFPSAKKLKLKGRDSPMVQSAPVIDSYRTNRQSTSTAATENKKTRSCIRTSQSPEEVVKGLDDARDSDDLPDIDFGNKSSSYDSDRVAMESEKDQSGPVLATNRVSPVSGDRHITEGIFTDNRSCLVSVVANSGSLTVAKSRSQNVSDVAESNSRNVSGVTEGSSLKVSDVGKSGSRNMSDVTECGSLKVSDVGKSTTAVSNRSPLSIVDKHDTLPVLNSSETDRSPASIILGDVSPIPVLDKSAYLGVACAESPTVNKPFSGSPKVTKASLESQKVTNTSLPSQKVNKVSLESQKVTRTSLENQKVTEVSMESQKVAKASLESQKVTSTTLKSQKGNKTSLESHKVTRTSLESQKVSKASLDNQKGTNTSFESQKDAKNTSSESQKYTTISSASSQVSRGSLDNERVTLASSELYLISDSGQSCVSSSQFAVPETPLPDKDLLLAEELEGVAVAGMDVDIQYLDKKKVSELEEFSEAVLESLPLLKSQPQKSQLQISQEEFLSGVCVKKTQTETPSTTDRESEVETDETVNSSGCREMNLTSSSAVSSDNNQSQAKAHIEADIDDLQEQIRALETLQSKYGGPEGATALESKYGDPEGATEAAMTDEGSGPEQPSRLDDNATETMDTFDPNLDVPVRREVQQSETYKQDTEVSDPEYGSDEDMFGPSQPGGNSSGPSQPRGESSDPSQPMGKSSGPSHPMRKSSGPSQPWGKNDGPSQPRQNSSGPSQPKGNNSGPSHPWGKRGGPNQQSGNNSLRRQSNNKFDQSQDSLNTTNESEAKGTKTSLNKRRNKTTGHSETVGKDLGPTQNRRRNIRQSRQVKREMSLKRAEESRLTEAGGGSTLSNETLTSTVDDGVGKEYVISPRSPTPPPGDDTEYKDEPSRKRSSRKKTRGDVGEIGCSKEPSRKKMSQRNDNVEDNVEECLGKRFSEKRRSGDNLDNCTDEHSDRSLLKKSVNNDSLDDYRDESCGQSLPSGKANRVTRDDNTGEDSGKILPRARMPGNGKRQGSVERKASGKRSKRTKRKVGGKMNKDVNWESCEQESEVTLIPESGDRLSGIMPLEYSDSCSQHMGQAVNVETAPHQMGQSVNVETVPQSAGGARNVGMVSETIEQTGENEDGRQCDDFEIILKSDRQGTPSGNVYTVPDSVEEGYSGTVPESSMLVSDKVKGRKRGRVVECDRVSTESVINVENSDFVNISQQNIGEGMTADCGARKKRSPPSHPKSKILSASNTIDDIAGKLESKESSADRYASSETMSHSDKRNGTQVSVPGMMQETTPGTTQGQTSASQGHTSAASSTSVEYRSELNRVKKPATRPTDSSEKMVDHHGTKYQEKSVDHHLQTGQRNSGSDSVKKQSPLSGAALRKLFPKKTHWKFTASGISKVMDKPYIQKLCELVGCQLVNKFTPSVTHVLVKPGEEQPLVCPRTLKYFQGIAGKVWVLSVQWAVQSIKQNRLLSEEEFEIQGDSVGSTKLHRAPARARLSGQLLLKNYEICCCGDFELLQRSDLVSLAELCGASTAQDPQFFSLSKNSIQVVVVEERFTKLMLELPRIRKVYGIPIVKKEWLLDSVGEFEIKEIEPYLV